MQLKKRYQSSSISLNKIINKLQTSVYSFQQTNKKTNKKGANLFFSIAGH